MNRKYLVIYVIDIETTIQEEFTDFDKAVTRYQNLQFDTSVYNLKFCEVLRG